MKSFWNFLKKNKLYGVINLVGLTVSMAFVLLLAVYVQRQLSTDTFQENADRIYVIANEDNVTMGYWLDKHLKNNFPEIEKGCCVANMSSSAAFSIDGERVYGSTMAADSTFFEIFSYDLVKGNKADWRVSWDRCMVSEEFANANFGEKDPIGQIIQFNYEGTFPLTVCGIYKEFGNSILKAPDVLVRGEMMPKTNSSAGGGICFVMAYPGADLLARQDDILSWCEEHFWVYKSQYDKVRIIPLRDMYFLNEGIRYGSDTIQFGNRSFVNLLLAMCLLLLAFAVLNYINMTTALTGFRAKEMATRRLVGAEKRSIFLKVISESTIICAISMLLAILLAEALAPTASRILEYQVSIFKAITPVGIHFQGDYACQCVACTGLYRDTRNPVRPCACPADPAGAAHRDCARHAPTQDQDGLQQGHYRGSECRGRGDAGERPDDWPPDSAHGIGGPGLQYQGHPGSRQCLWPDRADPSAAG